VRTGAAEADPQEEIESASRKRERGAFPTTNQSLGENKRGTKGRETHAIEIGRRGRESRGTRMSTSGFEHPHITHQKKDQSSWGVGELRTFKKMKKK